MPSSSTTPSPAPKPATSAIASTPRRRLLPSIGSPSPSSSFFAPTSPSPFHRFLPSPLCAYSVPFSWEHRPGIPKTPARSRSSTSSKQAGGGKLPLPPSLLSRGSANSYASAAVPVEYAAGAMQQQGQGDRRLGKVHRRSPLRRRRLRLADALVEWLSVLSLYRSYKRAAACFAAKAKSSAAAA
ncbi:hypothetical protein GUJ93_ZPchr0006g42376 [Zizania palustris]|uniref:Uncharacterized protein n=1 Tax=Zizania palustris TaxID=103762 RepID=A0A8J5T779_ZIZPA|nr:hypothetical protein GUJ93_ZPchr0006g42376 [Zizania palustris]